MASGTIKSVVPRSDIVNNLTTNDSTKVLSAAQGKALNDKIKQYEEVPTTTLTGDLDNALTPGCYLVDANCTNLPPTTATGKLVIEYGGSSNYVRQTYYCGYDLKIYTRTRYYSSNAWRWMEWHEVTNIGLNGKLTDVGTCDLICETNVDSYTEFTIPNSKTFDNYRFLYVFHMNSNKTALYTPHIIPISLFKTFTTNANPVSINSLISASSFINILLKYVSSTKLQVLCGSTSYWVRVYGVK